MTLGRIFFDLIVSGVATAGFALLFRTETRSLLPGALIGGVGYIVYDALALSSGSTVLAAFFACLLIGAISELAARRGTSLEPGQCYSAFPPNSP